MGIEAEFQTALFERLDAAPLGASVYDTAPQADDSGDETAVPYVTIGHIEMNELDTQTKTGWAAQVRIHTWVTGGAMLPAKNIQGLVFAALHRSPLTITGFNNYSLLRESTDCQSLEDGKIHGVCEYRALIESA